MKQLCSWAFLGLTLAADPLAALSLRDTGAARTVLPLQALGQGARPFGMGGAFVAVKGDLMALHFNPAGLAFLRGDQLSLQHNSWVADIRQESLSASMAGPRLASALALDWVDYGPVERSNSQGVNLGTFSPMDYGLGLALAKQWGRASLGLALRGVQQSLDEAGQTVLTADLGVLWSPAEMPVSLGASYSGLGRGLAGDPGTGVLRAGLSLDLASTAESGLLIALSGLGQSNSVSQVQVGLEGRLAGLFFLRAGYHLDLPNPALGAAGLSCGLGAQVKGLALDYAYLPFGLLGHNHRLGLSYHFSPAAAPQLRSDAPAVRPQAAPVAPAAPRAAAPLPLASPVLQAAPAAAGGPAVDMVFEIPAGGALSAAQWRQRGREHYARGERAQMFEAFEKALALEPDEELRAWLEKNRAVR